MIALGGSIGVGLFLGAGKRLHDVGPALILSYLVCGIAAFLVMRAIGELVMYRTTSGSFVEYAREFIGPWAGYVCGWMFWMNWAFTGVAEISAIGTYVHRWIPGFPQWITALIALGVLLSVNLVSVKLFGELEFWFAALKVTAIAAFLVVGTVLVSGSFKVGEYQAGVHNLTVPDGFFPHGIAVVLVSLQIVVFAYAGVEMVSIAAGETKDPHKIIPKAVNSVVWRIAIFYVGAVALLAMVLPPSAYGAKESPFVTAFSMLGVPWIGDVMNLVVLTAALSSVNSGMYSTARILKSMAENKQAPGVLSRMSTRHVPYAGILFTSAFYGCGVVLIAIVGAGEAFEVTVSIASLGVVAVWMAFLWCNLNLRRRALRGELERPAFRMPGAPYTNWITLGFLALTVAMMAFSADEATRFAFYLLPVVVGVLALGWYFISRNSRRAADSISR
ncbi:amino acid permease [Pseudonocardiaceae bacterium YIM PH 21723]|nr:amino acid permease [Pseudonocardiaceae bacterium YIM PH 21723]